MTPSLLPSVRALVRHAWHFRATPGGRVLFGGMVVSSLIALWSLELPVYQLLLALWYVAAAAFVLGWLMRPTVDLAGRGPTQTVTG